VASAAGLLFSKANSMQSTSDLQISGRDLAKVLGVSVANVSKLTTAGVLHAVDRGKYPLGPNVQAYLTDAKRKAAKESSQAVARARLIAAQAAKLELANAETDRRLIDHDDADAVTDEIMSAFMVELDGIGASVVRDQETRDKIDSAIDAALKRCGRRFQEKAEAFEITDPKERAKALADIAWTGKR
jgi:phage terminase Nu1 subunit (DNA packaging protein)